jgi:hypothetical protein
MRKSNKFLFVVSAALLAASCAAGNSVESVSRAEVEKLLAQAGMTANDKTEEGRLPQLTVSAKDGNVFNVQLDDCESKSPNRDQGCALMLFSSCWTVTMPGDRYWDAVESANGFNRGRWFGRAYVLGERDRLRAGENGTICVDTAMQLNGGVRARSIQMTADRFLRVVDQFRAYQRLGPSSASSERNERVG